MCLVINQKGTAMLTRKTNPTPNCRQCKREIDKLIKNVVADIGKLTAVNDLADKKWVRTQVTFFQAEDNQIIKEITIK
jgi:hypothetical protein